MRKLLLFACLALLSLSAFAQNPGPKAPGAVDDSIIGTSDLIVIGTIGDVVIGNPGDPAQKNGNNGSANTNANIRVDQIIKGGKIDNVNIKYSSFHDYKFAANQQKIFLLKRTQGGYTLAAYGSFTDADQLDKIADSIKDNPLKISTEEAIGPIFFGNNVELKVKVMNTGATPIEIGQNAFTIEGYPYSPLLPTYLQISTRMVLSDDDKPANPGGPAVLKNFIIDAGGEQVFTLKVTLATPQYWQLMTKDTYLQMPVAMRLTVRSNLAKDDNNKTIPNSQRGTATHWSTVMIGYALPDEINVEAGDQE